ncbi:MAG TPA: OadG family protein [Veillonellaceae bacterium]|nr:OadG family protein [Veillonellaceae bacterium]
MPYRRKVDYYMETPSPLSICITNMVIVFAVLIFLAFVIQLIHIVDPTKNKKK